MEFHGIIVNGFFITPEHFLGTHWTSNIILTLTCQILTHGRQAEAPEGAWPADVLYCYIESFHSALKLVICFSKSLV